MSFAATRTLLADVLRDGLPDSVSVYRTPTGQMSTPAVVVASIQPFRVDSGGGRRDRVTLWALASINDAANVEQVESFADPDHAWSIDGLLSTDDRTLGAYAVVETAAASNLSWGGVEYLAVGLTVDGFT